MEKIRTAYGKYCRQRFPAPSPGQVTVLEGQLGVALPSDYRRYLLEFNGGVFTEPRITPPEPACPLDRLTVMGGINAVEPFAELGAPGLFNPATFDDNDPPQLLPIGYTMMGNLIFIVVAEGADDTGHIGLKLISSDNLFCLGENMDELFSRLVDPPV